MKMNGKYLFIIIIVLILFQKNNSAQNIRDTLFIGSWNVENLFDTINDSGKSDGEFTPKGEKEWDYKKFNTKLKNTARVIRYMNNGEGPDLLGLIEVEHKYIIDSLVANYLMQKNYKVISYESPDKRGIQNAVIFNKQKFKLLFSEAIPVKFYESDYTTRDILHAKFLVRNTKIDVFINHWPSKLGGEERSEMRRIKAASVLRNKIESITESSENPPYFIIMGDFNDEPTDISINEILGAAEYSKNKINFDDDKIDLFNISYGLDKLGKGSHYFQNEWNMLDQIIISETFFNKTALKYISDSFTIEKPDFSIDEKYGRMFRTYNNGKYQAGFSDHFPVSAKFINIR